MNSVTKNVRTSLKYKGLLVLSAFFIIGCDDLDSNNKRKSISIYQGEPKAVNAKAEGITVKNSSPEFEVTTLTLYKAFADKEYIELTEKELETLQEELAGESVSPQVIRFDFSLSDKDMIKLDDAAEVVKIAFYSKNSKGELTEQLTGWNELDESTINVNDKDKKSNSFEFVFTATKADMIQIIRDEFSKMTRERNEDNPNEVDANEFMNLHLAFSTDEKTITKSIDLKVLCHEHPSNFNKKIPSYRSDGCKAL